MVALAGLLFMFPSAFAHDPLQSWVSATARADALELVITMAPLNALRLIGEQSDQRLTRDRFSQCETRFLKRAPQFCHVGGTTTLRPATALVALTDENDVTFTLTYPPVAETTLRIDARFLRQLGEDYTCIVVVSDESGRDLGWDRLTVEKSSLEVIVPARAAPKL